jgi:hypothetical protein
MIITPIDDQNNLFAVENVYSAELIAEIQTLDLMLYPYKNPGASRGRRRNLVFGSQDILHQLNVETTANLEKISEAIGILIGDSDAHVWLDYDQFKMGVHLDHPGVDGVDVVMQVYLIPNISTIGTKFYYNLDRHMRWTPDLNNLRHDFPYIINTGYIMINAPEQFHGIPYSVPKDTLRCSSYTYLFRQ